MFAFVHILYTANLCGGVERLWTRNVVHDQGAERPLEVYLVGRLSTENTHTHPAVHLFGEFCRDYYPLRDGQYSRISQFILDLVR